MGIQMALFESKHLDGPTGPEELAKIRKQAVSCVACPLCATRHSVVFGVGSASSPELAFVGEGPGKEEDLSGRPFVGASGRLLLSMLEAINVTRDEVFITNSVLCRPPENRLPTPKELAACRPLLWTQLRAVRPRVIVALGKTAAGALLDIQRAVKELRGKWWAWEGIPVRVTYHPAFLLRDAANKKAAWDDLQAVTLRLKG